MNRAYTHVEIRASADNGGKRRFTGVATTPSTDRMGDIVESQGAEFKLPLPLLWQHDSSDPIGWVTSAKVTKSGITIEGEVADVPDDGPLRERLAMAWQMLTSRLVSGLSIGFSPVEAEPLDAKNPWGATRFVKWLWLELSAVTIPANQDASILAIKSIDERLRALSGNAQPGVPPLSGNRSKNFPTSKGTTMKSIQEQLAELNETRSTKAARMNELMQAHEPDSALTEAEAAEFDGLETDVKSLDNEIRRKKVDAMNVANAKPVVDTSRASGHIIVKGKDLDEKFKGQNFVRQAIAKAIAAMPEYRGVRPSDIAAARWGKTNPTLVAIMKANEVPGYGSGSGEPGSELVSADNRYTGDFLEYLYARTVFDRLNLKQIPANVAIKGQDAAAAGYWVGESKAIPASGASFSSVNLAPLKVAALSVSSNELLRDSSPAAEALIRDSLVEASAQRIDTTFLSATAASAGVSPAGMLNGVSATAATGTDAAALRADLKTMFALFDAAKIYNGITLVTTQALARSISLMFNSLGTAQDFPGTTAQGGSLLGYTVLVGDNVPSGDIIAIAAQEVFRIGDLGVTVSVSTDAMIEQSSVPTGATDTPVAASADFTSMFQEESTAFKVVRPINFAKRRTAAVQVITGADYGAPES